MEHVVIKKTGGIQFFSINLHAFITHTNHILYIVLIPSVKKISVFVLQIISLLRIYR